MVVVNEDDDDSIDTRVTNLRKIGIRTGSDLVAACRSKSERERSCVADALRRDGETLTGAMTPCMAAGALERLPVWPRIVAWRKSPLAALDAALPLPPPSADLPSSTVQTADPALLDAMSSTNGH
jgi:hypothetical protein